MKDKQQARKMAEEYLTSKGINGKYHAIYTEPGKGLDTAKLLTDFALFYHEQEIKEYISSINKLYRNGHGSMLFNDGVRACKSFLSDLTKTEEG